MNIERISWENVPTYWPKIENWIASGLTESLMFQPADILGALLMREMTLWLAMENGEPKACAVTLTITHPRVKIGQYLIIAGMEMTEWLQVGASTIEKWAKDRGCDWMESPGRHGWKKVAAEAGYEASFTVYRKRL